MGAVSPIQGVHLLLERCASDERWDIYNSARAIAIAEAPEPFYDGACSGDDIDLPEEFRVEFPQMSDCYSDKKLKAGLQCVVDELNVFESNIDSIVTEEVSANKIRWQKWNDKCSQQPATAEVVTALDELRQIVDQEPNLFAEQERLTLELCNSEGFSRDAALRLAIERRLADFHEEPGIAANVVHERYLEVKEYTAGICYDRP